MKHFALLLLLAAASFGQAITLSMVCPTTQPVVGVPFTVPVNISGQSPAASQFSLIVPGSATGVSVATGTSAAAAAKAVSFANNIAIFWGLNTNLIAPGQLATVTMTIPTAGTYQIGLTAPVSGDVNASPLSTSVSSVCSVNVGTGVALNKCDTNGDNITDQADVVLADAWAHSNPAVALAQCNKNGDTACNVLDVLIIIKAVNTGICSAI